MKRKGSTPAVAALTAADVPFTVHRYEVGEELDTYGESVAAALGVEADRVCKTLLAVVDGDPVVAIVPVSGRLSCKALAAAAGGKKAELLDSAVAERLTGYVTGGISPFGQRRRLPTFVDEIVELFETIFVSAGRRGLQVELTPADLIHLLDAKTADLGT